MGKIEIEKGELLAIVGSNIRAIRASQGYSQEAFAKHSGFNRSYMGGVERGQRNLSAIGLIQIARALGVQVGKLFKGIK